MSDGIAKEASGKDAAAETAMANSANLHRHVRPGKQQNGALALGLFALLFSIYLLTFSGVYHASDEMAMLVTTDSLARRGAWDIELLRWMGEQQGSFGPDGHLYSRKGIGTTLAALPHYWLALQFERLGNVQTAMLTNAVTHALTGVLVYLLLRRLCYGQGAALGTALAYGLATMAWPYARYLFSESLAGLGLMLSFYFLVRYGTPSLGPAAFDVAQGRRRPGGKGAESPQMEGTDGGQWLYPLIASAGLGVALLARLNNAIVAPFLGLLLLVYLYRQHGRNWRAWLLPVTLFGLPVLVALAVAGWYNWLRFGSPLTTGYLPEERFVTPFLEGVYGLTLSPGKGLFWYNPILLAALLSWSAFFRRHRAEALLAAAVVLSNVAFYASWYLWWAGHGWGPRFLVTILPFAVLSLAATLEAAARRRMLAVGLGVLAAISVAIQIPGIVVDFNLYLEDVYARLGLYHPATLFEPAYSPLLQQWTYLRLGGLDLAWVRGGILNWGALAAGLGLVFVSALALWAAWHGRLCAWARGGLVLLLGLGAVISLFCYAPTGDIAKATHDLADMERPGEAGALTGPHLTESFQDAYDGQMWVWGVATKEKVRGEHNAVWAVGAGDPDPAAARFQMGEVRVDFYPLDPPGQSPAPGQRFDVSRLPVPALEQAPNLGNEVQLVATRLDQATVRGGETMPIALYWRALAPMDTSYTVFVQAIDEAGAKAGQIDRLPCDGGCPTTTWRPYDLVGERYDLSILPGAPPGRYQLVAGMYNLMTGERLPWIDAQGNAVGDYFPLGFVEVQPQVPVTGRLQTGSTSN